LNVKTHGAPSSTRKPSIQRASAGNSLASKQTADMEESRLETAEQALRRILKEIVEKKGPGYYAVKDISDLLRFQLGEP